MTATSTEAKRLKEAEAEDAIERHLAEVVRDDKFVNYGAVTGRIPISQPNLSQVKK